MKRFSILALDILALYSSLYLTLIIRYGSYFRESLGLHLLPFSTVFLTWILVFYVSNLYEISYLRNNVIFYSRYFQAIATNIAITLVFFYLIPFFIITPKTNLLIFALIFSVAGFLIRAIYNYILVSQTFRNNTIIVGLNQQSLELAKFIKENPQIGFQLKYIVNVSSQGSSEGFGEFEIIHDSDLEKIIKEEKIKIVILSPAAYQLPKIIDLFYKSLDRKINFYNLSDFYEKTTGKIPLGAIDQAWFLENLTEGTKRLYEFVKRIADVLFSIMLGIIALTLFPVIVLLIKMDSRGRVFYRQKRIGQYGQIFEIIKFRTMAENAESKSGAVWAQRNDPRVTRIGKILRSTRIDELPQLWNIFKGEMSFIGPRAERPEFHENLKKTIPFYEERYLIRPGLTGWAQVQYRYGASVKDAAEKLQYDLFYIKNRSPVIDLSIILKTINTVLRRAGQ